MDDLRLIENLGRDVPAWTDDDLTGARGRLLAEIEAASTGASTGTSTGTATGPAVPRPRRRRRVLGGLIGTAVAAAVAALVVLATTVFTGTDHTAVQPPTIDAASQQALLAAAAVVDKQPNVVPRPDQFLYVPSGSGAATWYSIDGTHDGLSIDGTERTSYPGCRNGKQLVGGNYPGLRPQPCTPLPAYLPDLPTDPQRLLRYMEKHFYTDPKDPNNVGKSVMDLVNEHYLRPAQWAALFEAFTQFPGLRVHQHATDNAGQPAFGIGWSASGNRNGELFFDPHTYRYTGMRTGNVKSGDVVGPMSIVDHAGQRP